MKMFKAYLQNSDFSIKEIRKFNLYPSNLLDKFEVLCNKIKELFPELNHKSFTISWKGNYYIYKDNFLFFLEFKNKTIQFNYFDSHIILNNNVVINLA